MSTTVTYKGSTLTTATNQTRVLETSGTWLEDDITITDVTASATLTTKSITANGTYNASSDNADGYSSVTVNVSGGGGATNVVSGSFTTSSTTGSVQSITIPYTGSGYPIAGIIFPTGGVDGNADFSALVQRYAINEWAFAKRNTTTTPDYTSGGSDNYAYAVLSIKGTTATSYTNVAAAQANVYFSTNPTANSSTVAKFNNATTLKIYIADASYGFKSEMSYSYVFVYSS